MSGQSGLQFVGCYDVSDSWLSSQYQFCCWTLHLNFTLHNNKCIIVDPNTKQLIKDAVFRQMGQANDNDTEPSHCPTVNIPSKPASRDPSQTLSIQPQPAQVQTLQFNLNQNEPQRFLLLQQNRYLQACPVFNYLILTILLTPTIQSITLDVSHLNI